MVLNGRRKGVSQDSYEKIWDHAGRSGYRPKGIATELLKPAHKAGAVGLVLREGATLYSQSPFFGHVQHGIHDFLSEKRIPLIFLGVEDDLDIKPFEQLQDPEAFMGLIILGEVSRSFLQAILKLAPRVVTISCRYPGLCHSVVSNEEQAADLLVEHLLNLGHEKFAWIGGNKGMQRPEHRLRAIQSALRTRNIEIDPKFCVDVCLGGRKEGAQVAEKLLEAANVEGLPTAWIYFNGVMARGAINHLSSRGIKVPEEVSIAAFDSTRVCEEEYPTLTSAATSPEQMGRIGAEILLESRENELNHFTDNVLSAELFPRESTTQAPDTAE